MNLAAEGTVIVEWYGVWLKAELKLKTPEEVKFWHVGNDSKDGWGTEVPGGLTVSSV